MQTTMSIVVKLVISASVTNDVSNAVVHCAPRLGSKITFLVSVAIKFA